MNDDGFFGKEVAETYDRLHGASDTEQVAAMVALLKALAEGGPVLEFAISGSFSQ